MSNDNSTSSEDLPVENYDEMTVDELRADLSERDLSAEEMQQLKDYETQNKNRSSALDVFESHAAEQGQTEEAEAGAQETGGTAEAAAAPDDEEATDAEADADAESASESPAPESTEGETELEADVQRGDDVWISPQTSRIAGEGFRHLHTPHRVKLTYAIEQAILDGRAALLENYEPTDPPEEYGPDAVSAQATKQTEAHPEELEEADAEAESSGAEGGDSAQADDDSDE